MTAVERWFASKQPALIAGKRVQLKPHPALAGSPLSVARGQGVVYWLNGDSEGLVLKSFHPGLRPERQYMDDVVRYVPRHPSFRAGWKRHVLSQDDLAKAPGTFASTELATWLDGTILMPGLPGGNWSLLLSGITQGRNSLNESERLRIAWQLAEAILLLESLDVSHRDLSATNILLERGSHQVVSLVDWDSIYHPRLFMSPNTTLGTQGYMAPFLWQNQEVDAPRTWGPKADRFALAVCVAEVLSVQEGDRLRHDGGLFEQGQLGRFSVVELPDAADQVLLRRVGHTLGAISPTLASLFEQAWVAHSFEECPAPADWLQALNSVLADHSASRPTLSDESGWTT